MNPEEVLIPIMGILLVMIPVAGLTLILTMRFALKPFVETLSRALRESGFSSGSELRLHIEDLAQRVSSRPRTSTDSCRRRPGSERTSALPPEAFSTSSRDLLPRDVPGPWLGAIFSRAAGRTAPAQDPPRQRHRKGIQ